MQCVVQGMGIAMRSELFVGLGAIYTPAGVSPILDLGESSNIPEQTREGWRFVANMWFFE
jgi:hypothetical protein